MYRVDDGSVSETRRTMREAYALALEWYQEGAWDQELIDAAKDMGRYFKACPRSFTEAQKKLRTYLNAVAEKMGYERFQGHGNYYRDAASQARLNLSIEKDD